jgi:hypothetical protein
MATDRANDLHAFKNFIDEQLAAVAVPTVDEVLARWDSENETAGCRAGYPGYPAGPSNGKGNSVSDHGL